MLIAGIRGMAENDFKKIIALSTLSQLGLMVACIGAGLVEVAFFHLVLHAFFKAMLFIAAGFAIHSRINFQDIRRMQLLP